LNGAGSWKSLLKDNLYVALIHYPVMNKRDEPIGSALTTIDMHDIARAAITFGVRGFYVVTPYEDQAMLATQVIEHWTKGVGGKLNPFRKQALELIRVVPSVEDAVESIQQERKEAVVTIATSAKGSEGSISIDRLRTELENNASHVILFGTAWGLADELMEACDLILDPISGKNNYNHLSVRSAVSIYLDRIINI
jgi:tRNA (guanine37-N1)-methyltransferase